MTPDFVALLLQLLFFSPFLLVLWAGAIRCVWLMVKGKWPWEK